MITGTLFPGCLFRKCTLIHYFRQIKGMTLWHARHTSPTQPLLRITPAPPRAHPPRNGLPARPPGHISPCIPICIFVGCYCRASLPNGSRDDTQCDTGCDAKPDEACGGEHYILFYGNVLPGTAPSLQPYVGDSSRLLGCYSLHENRPILTEGPIKRSNKMTNEVRIDYGVYIYL